MIRVDLLSFGIAREIVDSKHRQVTLEREGVTVGEVRLMLYNQYPRLKSLASLAIGVNDEYVDDDFVLKNNDEVILIPPVSGG